MYTLKVQTETSKKEIHFSCEYNLSQLLIDNDTFVDRACGGKGTCGKCAIRFLSPAPQATQADKNYFSAEELQHGWRLSCRTIISSDAEIILPNKESHYTVEYGFAHNNEIFFNDKSLALGYGIAIDLGTTTIVVYLISLSDGNLIGVTSSANPQRQYGDNVITRCEYIHSHENGLNELKAAALNKINELVSDLTNKHNIPNKNILRCVLSGNTIMQHIIAGIDPYSISTAPYTPVFTDQKKVKASALGINIASEANCFITNSISGYIGGDIVSGISAVSLNESESPAMLIDIGTNGEMALSCDGKIYSCSVAAGPAFEGEHIKFGVSGIPGAINKVYFEDNRLQCKTINSAAPVGICGAGLLDITALLLEKSILDKTGALDESKCDKIDDEAIYYITKDIYISQKDIREIQLAKAAVAAGIEVLISKAGITYDQIDTVYLSGGFGSFINVKSAVTIGLIDKKLESKCISSGNTSGMGSIKSLLSDNVLNSLSGLTENVEYIELSFDKDFKDLFINNMMF